MKEVLLVAALSAFGMGAASANNLVLNGSFETQTIPSGNFLYTHTVTDWSAFSSTRGIILFNLGYQPVAAGVNAVQLELPGDYISQSFATVAGQTYQLSFALSGYNSPGQVGDNGGANLRVTAGNLNVAVAAPSGSTPVTQILSFVASAGATTLLKFESLGTSLASYPQLDNVSVTAVPEPGSYALMLSGLAVLALVRRRKA